MDRSLVALCVMSMLVGCSMRNVPVDLPTVTLDPPMRGGRERQVVVVIPFRDERVVRNRCGMRTNSFNMDSADAVCQADPNEWFARLFADALRASGFTVLRTDEEHHAGAVRVEGSLLKLFIEPLRPGTVEADLSIQLRVTSATGLEATRTFFVKGWKRALTAGSGGYHLSLLRSTQAILEQMVTAVVELMDEYPQLGRNDGDIPQG